MMIVTINGVDMNGARKRPDLTVIVSSRLAEWMKNSMNLDTQKKLADQSGVGQTTIGRILNGGVSPTLDSLERISVAFGKEVTDLVALPDTGSIDYDKKAYSKLPDYEKVRVEGFIKHAIAQYNK